MAVIFVIILNEGITFESYVKVVAAKPIFQRYMIYGDIRSGYRQRVH